MILPILSPLIIILITLLTTPSTSHPTDLNSATLAANSITDLTTMTSPAKSSLSFTYTSRTNGSFTCRRTISGSGSLADSSEMNWYTPHGSYHECRALDGGNAAFSYRQDGSGAPGGRLWVTLWWLDHGISPPAVCRFWFQFATTPTVWTVGNVVYMQNKGPLKYVQGQGIC